VSESSYIAKNGNDIYLYRIENDELHCEWRRPFDSSYEIYPISMFSSEFHVWNGRSDNVTKKIQRGGFFLFGAVVLYFSELQASFPYASFVLLILGIGHLYNDIHWACPAAWTIIKNKEGVSIVYILHSDKGTKNRSEFEERLSSVIINCGGRENET